MSTTSLDEKAIDKPRSRIVFTTDSHAGTFFSASRTTSVKTLKSDLDERYVSFEPMKSCSHCDRLTPFLFHILGDYSFAYRLCWEHVGEPERTLVREMYATMTGIVKKIE